MVINFILGNPVSSFTIPLFQQLFCKGHSILMLANFFEMLLLLPLAHHRLVNACAASLTSVFN